MRIHGKSETKEYHTWTRIRYKCQNKNNRQYKWYGARGITVCDRWNNSFDNFISDMGLAPSANHSIERLNNNGHYEPGNCEWRTQIDQANNTRRCVYLKINGVSKTVSQWARDISTTKAILFYKLKTIGRRSTVLFIKNKITEIELLKPEVCDATMFN